jgi:polysaccharide pyruvyl transferase WcaK-like protein
MAKRPAIRRADRRSVGAQRVGFFGLLGSGNAGNDASFEVMLEFVRRVQPGAVVDAMCMGPERLRAQYGVDTTTLHSLGRRTEAHSGVEAVVLKALGKAVDACRIVGWTRHHDVVIVPGMGVFETSLPVRPTQLPYKLFVLCASAKSSSTKVTFVSVGATRIDQRLTRWLLHGAARLAYYRSYRDTPSRSILQQARIGPDDGVYPDVVFGLDVPECGPGDARQVGVGVMTYPGNNDNPKASNIAYRRYIATLAQFVRWLIDTRHQVQLFGGDDHDAEAIRDILTACETCRPRLAAGSVTAEPITPLRDQAAAVARVGTFIGTRHHNVVLALRLSRPTISIGYSTKHDAAMATMGMERFALSLQTLDLDELIARFSELEHHSTALREQLLERNIAQREALNTQFARLTTTLFSNDSGAASTTIDAPHSSEPHQHPPIRAST